MSWINKAKEIFRAEKPEHFTDFTHCEECAEHDQTLLQFDIDTIGLEQLGNPGWDPLCFCSPEGKIYYMPALIRLSLESIFDVYYLEQLLFHLEYEGFKNTFYQACSEPQRAFIVQFMAFLIANHAELLEQNLSVDEIFRVSEIWSGQA